MLLQRLLFSSMSLGLCALSGVLAFGSLRTEVRYADLLHVAGRMQSGDSIETGFLSRVAAGTWVNGTAGPCYPRQEAAAAGIAISYFYRQNPAIDYDAWSAALDGMHGALIRGLACLPGNGALWAHLAVVEAASALVPERQALLLERSASLAPAEIGVVAARFKMWERSASWRTAALNVIFQRDVETIMTRALSSQVLALLHNMSGPMAGEIARVEPLLTPDRSLELKRVGLFEVTPPPSQTPLLFFDTQ